MHHRLLTAMAAALCVIVMAGGTAAHPLYPGLEGYKVQSRHPAYAGKRSDVAADAVAIAKRYLGTRPAGMMRRLWCAQFMGMIERKAGRAGTGSNLARSYEAYGKAVPKRQARRGDIVVLERGKRGGHVGYALAPPAGGKIKLRSGNTGGRRGNRIVADGYYPMARVIAVRRPS